MKILLFGGTFDPPHNGHIALLKASIETVCPDLVIVIPTAMPPHKAAPSTAFLLRLAMCKAFLPCFENIVIDDYEIVHSGKSYTADTVAYLKEKYKGADFFLCVGSDMLLSFNQWYRYETLLLEVTLVAHLRANADIVAQKKAIKGLRDAGGKVIETLGEVLEISSSEVRAMHTRGEDIAPFVPQEVQKIITQNKLYQEGERYRVDYRKRM